MRHLLQLHPHKHTGKVLHHKHTSYHALFLIFGLAGIFMIFLGSAARAADIVVTGTIPAPIPTGEPVINMPGEDSVITSPTLAFAGTCPIITPQIIIVLNDDTSSLGSGQCTIDGTFNVPITLTPGTHNITGTVTTITGGIGETSDPVTVTYNPPVISTAPSTTTANKPSKGGPIGSSTSSSSAPAPLEIISDTPFIVFGPIRDAEWRGGIAGGIAPYNFSIDWGDGAKDAYHNRSGDIKSYSHHYNHIKSYRVTIRISDATGQTTSRVVAAISPATFNQPTGGAGSITSKSFLTTWIYALYAGLFGMFIIFWRYEQKRHQFQPIPIVAKRRKPNKTVSKR